MLKIFTRKYILQKLPFGVEGITPLRDFVLYSPFGLGALLWCFLLLTSCKHAEVSAEEPQKPCGPEFVADSAYLYCQKQCDFGPRTMNSDAHKKCMEWIKSEFERFGCTVSLQQADLKGYDGTMLHSANIIASTHPDRQNRLLVCAHYDSRPWADNDPDSKNHKTPIIAANDGASGVAVMLEVARLMQKNDSTNIGVDFVCFDAEDYGTPQWEKNQEGSEGTWALGAQYWAKSMANSKRKPQYGILLDMVGGKDAAFYQEGMSMKYAKPVVDNVWNAAKVAGYESMFPITPGGYITDDHIPVNEVAGIPCVDIIPYYPNCQQSNFGPTWHTVLDTMDNISKETLKAVGQTIIQVIYSE